MQLRSEHDALVKEREGLDALLDSPAAQWKTIAAQIRDVKRRYGADTPLGRRRTSFEEMPAIQEAALAEAMVEREPVTVVVSKKGWIRALKGHGVALEGLAFKGDDGLRLSFATESTAKILVVTLGGKAFTLEAARLPGGRGVGDPIRIMADIDDGDDGAAVLAYRPGTRLLLVARDGRGFSVSQDDLVSATRKGKAVMGLEEGGRVAVVTPDAGDHVAVIGENRKLLVFPAEQLPQLARGKGMRLQRYKDGSLSDAKTFALADGLTWRDSSGRTWTVPAAELREWIGNRAEAGRLPPKGFPRDNRFGG